MVENAPRKPVNELIAENLAYWMAQSETLKTQSALALAAGVAQTTISYYLNPQRRLGGTKGKTPSAKVAELDRIATALGVEVWHLLRDMKPKERAYYRKMEEAYAGLVGNDPSGVTGNTESGGLEQLPSTVGQVPGVPRASRLQSARGRVAAKSNKPLTKEK